MADDGRPGEEKPSSGGSPSDHEGDESGESGEEPRGPITFDRFKNRRKSAVSWPHVVILVLMLATLLVLLTFKNHCGRAVSGFIFMTTARDRGPTPNVRIQVTPPTASPGTGSGK
jgi:hypothetical protein